MTSHDDIDVQEFIGAVSHEEAEQRRRHLQREAEQQAIQYERDVLDGKHGDNGTIPLASKTGAPPHLNDPGSLPTFMSRLRRGGRSRTIALANLLATIVEPLAVLVLWCIPADWAQTMLKTDNESGQARRYVSQVLRRKALAVVDFLLGTGLFIAAVAMCVFLIRDVYINQRHSVLARIAPLVGLIRTSRPAYTPPHFSVAALASISKPGEINFIESTRVRPVTTEELSAGVLRDVELFTDTAHRIDIDALTNRMRAVASPSAEHLGVPLRILNPKGTDPKAGFMEWVARMSDCNAVLINPATYDSAADTASVALPADNWLPARTVHNVPTWIVVDHDVNGNANIKEMCTLRNLDAAYFTEAIRRWGQAL